MNLATDTIVCFACLEFYDNEIFLGVHGKDVDDTDSLRVILPSGNTIRRVWLQAALKVGWETTRPRKRGNSTLPNFRNPTPRASATCRAPSTPHQPARYLSHTGNGAESNELM